MQKVTCEKAFASYRRTFDGVLRTFPLPTGPHFATFVAALQGLGCKADSVTLSSRGPQLIDTSIECSLFGGAFLLKLSYGWLELAVPSLGDAELEVLPMVLQTTLAACLGADAETLGGVTRITYGGHLALPGGGADDVLRDHLPLGRDSSVLSPGVCVYNLTLEDFDGDDEATIGLTKSKIVQSGIYFELNWETRRKFSVDKMVDRIDSLRMQAFDSVGFEFDSKGGAVGRG